MEDVCVDVEIRDEGWHVITRIQKRAAVAEIKLI